MKISVIVPAYNAEKYLGACLESLLIQTCADFEVIVVDDCSTDATADVAEIFLTKFNGRLKIISLAKNTGSGAVPRNVGLEFSCGEYVFFMDADDLLIDEALETLYNYAEEYQADAVYMECGFICDEKIIPEKLIPAAWKSDSNLEQPTLATDDINVRVKKFLNFQYRWPPWAKFLRRDFLIENDIKFPHMKISEDIIWTFKLVCFAKKILRIPTALYVQRNNQISMTRRVRSPKDDLTFWINPLINGLDCLEKFMSGLEFFKQNSTVRLQVLNLFLSINLQHMSKAFAALETEKVYEIFLREFTAAKSSQPALISYLLLMNNLYRNELKSLT